MQDQPRGPAVPGTRIEGRYVKSGGWRLHLRRCNVLQIGHSVCSHFRRDARGGSVPDERDLEPELRLGHDLLRKKLSQLSIPGGQRLELCSNAIRLSSKRSAESALHGANLLVRPHPTIPTRRAGFRSSAAMLVHKIRIIFLSYHLRVVFLRVLSQVSWRHQR